MNKPCKQCNIIGHGLEEIVQAPRGELFRYFPQQLKHRPCLHILKTVTSLQAAPGYQRRDGI